VTSARDGLPSLEVPVSALGFPAKVNWEDRSDLVITVEETYVGGVMTAEVWLRNLGCLTLDPKYTMLM
jgi:hypothetical protein